MVGVVDDDGAGFAGHRVEQRVDRASGVLAGTCHRGGGLREAGVRHGRAQPRSEELGRHATFVQGDFDRNRVPCVDQLRAEDGLAVSGARLDHDDARLKALRGQPRTPDVVRRQTAHFAAPLPVPSAFLAGRLRGV